MAVSEIIGIDCATQPDRVGLALAKRDGDAWVFESVCTGSTRRLPVDIVARWILQRQGPLLLALDAPLGWPAALGKTLIAHLAGAPVAEAANRLFRRETDRAVRRITGKQPLDVGAGWIARTAHWALAFLAELRQQSGLDIPLVWNREVVDVGAIEVYPAATLIGHGVEITGYKNVKNVERREAVLAKLAQYFVIETFQEMLLTGPDVLDACLCVLAGLDFLRNDALPPGVHLETAKREGWIWFKGGMMKL